jgi:hypothetical protein
VSHVDLGLSLTDDPYEAVLVAIRAYRLRVPEGFRVCASCGTGFESRQPRARFCSDPCRKRVYQAVRQAVEGPPVMSVYRPVFGGLR